MKADDLREGSTVRQSRTIRTVDASEAPAITDRTS
jgi:hypothetical protein